MPRLLMAVAAALLMACTAAGQELLWSVDYSTVLNNREGGDGETPDQTFFFARVSPEIGVGLMNGRHQLKGGVSWYQPINDDWDGYKLHPTLYYTYTRRHWRMAAGAMPRTLLRERLPLYLWSDSMAYRQPNVRGALVQYTAGSSYWQMALDWRQMQSATRREAFNAIFSGRWHPGRCAAWLGGYLQYNHLAKRKDAPADEGVNDDVTVNPLVGIDLSRHTALDSLAFSAGAVVQMQRARSEGKWHTPCAFVASATAQWRWLGITEQVKAGKDLYPLYDRFGSELNMGDPYYRHKFYSRTDIWARIVGTRFADVRTTLSFHTTGDGTFGFWQQVAVRFYIDNAVWSHRHNPKWLQRHKLGNTY